MPSDVNPVDPDSRLIGHGAEVKLGHRSWKRGRELNLTPEPHYAVIVETLYKPLRRNRHGFPGRRIVGRAEELLANTFVGWIFLIVPVAIKRNFTRTIFHRLQRGRGRGRSVLRIWPNHLAVIKQRIDARPILLEGDGRQNQAGLRARAAELDGLDWPVRMLEVMAEDHELLES